MIDFFTATPFAQQASSEHNHSAMEELQSPNISYEGSLRNTNVWNLTPALLSQVYCKNKCKKRRRADHLNKRELLKKETLSNLFRSPCAGITQFRLYGYFSAFQL
jgi:hypothetical protein